MNQPEWKSKHEEYYKNGPTTEEKIGIFLLFAIPVVWLFFVGMEVLSYHMG